MSALIDGYDAALFDLDGVVYLGPQAVPGAAEGIAELRARGVAVGFVTNNAARTPQQVSDHLVELGVTATADDVVTSAQAVARVMASELASQSRVLVTGSQALADEVRRVGLRVVDDWRDSPAAVVQGYDPQMTQARLDAAGFAIQRGARWYASNTDATRPTDLGVVPGAGAQIGCVRQAVQVDPIVAGKPFAPLMHETVSRLGAHRSIFVGDRLDTDIEGASRVGMDSLFVFTGAHGKADLLAAHPAQRPTHVGLDLRALVQPVTMPTAVTLDSGIQRDPQVHRVVLDQVPDSAEEQVAVLWQILQLVWATGADGSAAAAKLTRVP